MLKRKYIRRGRIANVRNCGDRDETINHIVSEYGKRA